MNRESLKSQVVLGIDIGFGTTGLCQYNGGLENRPYITKLELSEKITKWPGYKKFIKTFFSIDTGKFQMLIKQADLIVIEKPFNVPGHGKILLELLGIIKRELIHYDKPFIEVPQTTLKKFATGKGNAKKSDMCLRAFKEFKVEAESEDEIDAFWACLLGHCILTPEKFSKARQDSIKKLEVLR